MYEEIPPYVVYRRQSSHRLTMNVYKDSDCMRDIYPEIDCRAYERVQKWNVFPIPLPLPGKLVKVISERDREILPSRERDILPPLLLTACLVILRCEAQRRYVHTPTNESQHLSESEEPSGQSISRRERNRASKGDVATLRIRRIPMSLKDGPRND